jgi:hypothetical protein
MHIARRLARGVASWLSFEFYCRHGHLFEEKYLTYPLGQILSSEYGEKVASEINHPLLTEHTVGPGKRPKMDFAVVQDNQVLVSLEAKWAGSTPLKVEGIIWDLIRLELMASHYDCESLFVLAGQRRKIKALFESNAFLAPSDKRPPRPILKDGIHRSLGMKLDHPPRQREQIVKRLVSRYPNIEMPSKISSGKPFIYPSQCNGGDFQVYVWQIVPASPRHFFLANKHKLYA